MKLEQRNREACEILARELVEVRAKLDECLLCNNVKEICIMDQYTEITGLRAMLAICEDLDPRIVEQARLKIRESANPSREGD